MRFEEVTASDYTTRRRNRKQVRVVRSLRSEVRGLSLCCLLFSPPWTLSRSRGNWWTSNPSPAMKLRSETIFTENFAVSAIRRRRCRSRAIASTSMRHRPEHPHPAVVFSTHMDTVPPFIPSSEDAGRIYGRGSCDAKGIIAAQIAAAERLRQQNIYVGLLFVVGEERDSLGAQSGE